MSTTARPATIEDLYKVQGKAELVNGEIVHMSPTGCDPGRAGDAITVSLWQYATQRGTGLAVGDNKAFRVNLPHRQSLTVPIIALGVSGFVFASPWASNLTYTICMAVLFFAVVAVLFARSERRLLWAGFAAFGWGYWFLAFEGTNHEQSRQIAMRPALRFVTSDVIDALERFRSSSYPSGSRVLVEWQGTYWPATTGGTTVAGDRYLIDWGDGSPSIWANPSQIMPFSPHSRHAAHSLFCLSFGLIGAMASVWTLRDCTFSKEEAPDVAG